MRMLLETQAVQARRHMRILMRMRALQMPQAQRAVGGFL
jgi:hypothetical protein